MLCELLCKNYALLPESIHETPSEMADVVYLLLSSLINDMLMHLSCLFTELRVTLLIPLLLIGILGSITVYAINTYHNKLSF